MTTKSVYLNIVIFILICCFSCENSENTTQNNVSTVQDDSPKVFLITLDGLRWQELFEGADSLLLNSEYTKGAERIKALFWKKTATERRNTLMPFFWNTVAKKGQMYGNRKYNNNVNLTNSHWFSYPGYNEILCGFADDKRINSNDKNNNPNVTILEQVNNLPDYKGKVGAFASWDVFPFIVNESRNGIYVNAGYRKAKHNLNANETYLNQLQDQAIQPWGSVRQDVFTHNYALEFIKKESPKLMYISYGETDDFAHDGDYSHYLLAAKNTDAMIKELWDYCQNNPFYKNNTTFIITTDHGRGTIPLEAWKSHGKSIDGSDETWIAVLGNKVVPKGELKNKMQCYNDQIAATVLDLLNVTEKHPKMGTSLVKQIQQ